MERWLATHDRPPALAETAPFARAVRRELLDYRERFALLESELGLYTAIAHLPERQYDIVVLRYVLGYTDEQISYCTGIKISTVRSNARHAKRRLARELNMATEPETEE